MAIERSGQGHGVGASVLRKEDDRHLRGRGLFVADIPLQGTRLESAARAGDITISREYRMNRQSGELRWSVAVFWPIAITGSMRSWFMPRRRRRTPYVSRSPKFSGSRSVVSELSRPMSVVDSGQRPGSIPRKLYSPRWRSSWITRCAGSRSATNIC